LTVLFVIWQLLAIAAGCGILFANFQGLLGENYWLVMMICFVAGYTIGTAYGQLLTMWKSYKRDRAYERAWNDRLSKW
jgi:uncharacterized membrane protein YdfJ with MMPL/SSD domain